VSDDRLTGSVIAWNGTTGWVSIDGQRDSIFLHRNKLRAVGIAGDDITLNTRLRFSAVPSTRRSGHEVGGHIQIEAVPELPMWWVKATSKC
jgi:hypothetical protein